MSTVCRISNEQTANSLNVSDTAPLVSVIMPTYNCGKYIAQSVESVIAQTMTNWELIIIDDNGTDDTDEIVFGFQQRYPNKITYIKMPQNGGPGAARTVGMRKAQGKYIAFLDSDDIWLPQKLELQIGFMKKQGSVFSCTGYAQMDENGHRLASTRIPPRKTDYNKMLRLSDPIGNLTVMYDQEQLGKYEVPNIKKRNDFALWLKILHDTPCCDGMREVLAVYRVRKNSVSANKLALVQYHWKLYRDIEKLNLIKAIWAMGCWVLVKGLKINKKGNEDLTS